MEQKENIRKAIDKAKTLAASELEHLAKSDDPENMCFGQYRKNRESLNMKKAWLKFLWRTHRKGIYAVSAIETMIMCRILKESGLSGKITAIGTDVFPELLQYYKDGTLTASTFQNPIQQGYLAVKMMAQSIISPSDKESVYSIPASAVFRSTAPDFCR